MLEQTKQKISNSLKGHIPWNKGKIGIYSKETLEKISRHHWNWKGGICSLDKKKYRHEYWIKNKDFLDQARKEYRHKRGISKQYRNKYTGISKTKEYKKLVRQKRKALMKGGGELSIKKIQLVYEDNIKQYGTLTCYLCLKSIPFGQDHLEHKTPLSRGGTNDYNNLGIACQKCNCKKHIKTEEEYKKEKNVR